MASTITAASSTPLGEHQPSSLATEKKIGGHVEINLVEREERSVPHRDSAGAQQDVVFG